MNTVQHAHAAGKADGERGLGPAPPRTGPPGSPAHARHAAYMQSYRDALIARVGTPDRGKNPRAKRTAPARRRARRAPRGKTVTTVSHSKVIRRTNPRALVALYARKPGRLPLKYLGHGKFGNRGRAVLFRSAAEANTVARVLVDALPHIFRGWTVRAGAPEADSTPPRRRRLPQGEDPAEVLYREKVRADTEAAHRWLARQKK